MKIILFEDTADQATRLLEELQRKVDGNGEVLQFQDPGGGEGTFENRLSGYLTTGTYSGATLIVADRDLSKTTGFTGLSESSVRRAGDALGIPECSYQRFDQGTSAVPVEQREECISVSLADGFESCAAQIVAIEHGFADIRAKLSEQLAVTGKKSPGKLLAGILGKPEYAEKISLYASGDQNRLVDVLRIRKSKGDSQLNQITCHLGYWLWDSVLRFPGVVLNEVAAASYLNIHGEAFKDDVRAQFESALYNGPFADAAGPMWWRGMLDDLIAADRFPDGRSYAIAKLGREVARSECSEDSGQTAGYYCMLSNRPVSLANSHAGLPWFPRGAGSRTCK